MNRDAKKILHAGRILALVKEGHWEYAERNNVTGAAIIIAVTDEQKLLLVEQYRIPVHSRTIELPESSEMSRTAVMNRMRRPHGVNCSKKPVTMPSASRLSPQVRPPVG